MTERLNTSYKIRELEEVDNSANMLSYITVGYQYLFDLKMVWFSRKQSCC